MGVLGEELVTKKRIGFGLSVCCNRKPRTAELIGDHHSGEGGTGRKRLRGEKKMLTLKGWT